VHIWYKSHYGKDILPYISLESSIDTRPTTSNCIGIRKEFETYKIYAPYGLDDMLQGIVRANKKQITQEMYEQKVKRWKQFRPELQIIPR
jgi:hypothetical protein